MATTTINSDVRINGHLSATTQTLAASSVSNAQVASDADIDADKLQHLYKSGTNFALAVGGTPAAREEIVWVCQATDGATVRNFRCLLNDTGTNTSVTFDLKKNGTTILSSVVTITHSIADRAVQTGTLSSTALVQGDVLTIALAVTSTTGAQGPYAWVEVEEFAP